MYRIFRRLALLLALLFVFVFVPAATGADAPSIKVMTRNMDAGTDLGYIFTATDPVSLALGVAATLQELKESKLDARAKMLADEIEAEMPDLVGLQEVTLFRKGALMKPPAREVLYDQLQSLMDELDKKGLHYAVVTTANLVDAELPAPTAGMDIRMTDRDVIIARSDLPASVFDVYNATTRRYKTIMQIPNDVTGPIPVLRGWMSVEVTINGIAARFYTTHLETLYPGPLNGPSRAVQLAQAAELVADTATSANPVIIAGDFNANADPGIDFTETTRLIMSAGFLDAYRTMNINTPGLTWPLFGEDQFSGPTVPWERIDLIFGKGLKVLSAKNVGTEPARNGLYTSDHAGVVAAFGK
jgi:endonuclease/exonuclease/phosphatase family metal-dependent hydrolase